MGKVTSINANRFTIGFNKRLNTQLIQILDIKSSPNEVSNFKKFINKKLTKEFTPSNFMATFKDNSKALTNSLCLLDIIYSKATKKELLQFSNQNMYSAVFNYNIIPKDSIVYERFNKRTITSFESIITGEPQDYYNSTLNLNNQSSNNISKVHHCDSLFSKSNTIKLKSINNNDTLTVQEIINAIEEVSPVKQDNSFKKNKKKKLKTNINQQEDKETEISVDNSLNKKELKGKKKRNLNDKSEANFKLEESYSSRQLLYENGNRRPPPKKPPLVNIKLNINDLLKLDIYENSVLEPSEYYEAKNKGSTKNDKSKYRFNNTNAYKLDISADQKDITIIKPNHTVANVNDSFLNIVDCFTQSNKKRKDIIHSNTPIKSKLMKLPDYLKSNNLKNQKKYQISASKLQENRYKTDY